MTASPDFQRQLKGYGLTTAQILYRMPDHRNLVQEYLWQEYDLSPDFPELKKFLDFWRRNLDGPVLSVTITHANVIKPTSFNAPGHLFLLN
ncbi:MAG: usg protein [Proteobacteria bacterium]|nr:usg protein [Pseudomonadota bacterium]